MEAVNYTVPVEAVNRLDQAPSGVEPIDVVEWLNEKAQAAKQRDDYECFEYWRRAYLNAQAAQRRERRTGVGSKFDGRERSVKSLESKRGDYSEGTANQ